MREREKLLSIRSIKVTNSHCLATCLSVCAVSVSRSCSPLSGTHHRRPTRHCLIAQSVILWSNFCQNQTCVKVTDVTNACAIHRLLQYSPHVIVYRFRSRLSGGYNCRRFCIRSFKTYRKYCTSSYINGSVSLTQSLTMFLGSTFYLDSVHHFCMLTYW